MPRPAARKAKSYFEAGLLHRLKLQYGDTVDVDKWADWVMDFASRKPVGNPDGLLVTKIREEAARASQHVPGTLEEREAEANRYAAFQVDLYRMISEQQLGPGDVARFLDEARRNGLPLINMRTIERLQLLGDHWPAPD